MVSIVSVVPLFTLYVSRSMTDSCVVVPLLIGKCLHFSQNALQQLPLLLHPLGTTWSQRALPRKPANVIMAKLVLPDFLSRDAATASWWAKAGRPPFQPAPSLGALKVSSWPISTALFYVGQE